jgi:hypothetical protein
LPARSISMCCGSAIPIGIGPALPKGVLPISFARVSLRLPFERLECRPDQYP